MDGDVLVVPAEARIDAVRLAPATVPCTSERVNDKPRVIDLQQGPGAKRSATRQSRVTTRGAGSTDAERAARTVDVGADPRAAVQDLLFDGEDQRRDVLPIDDVARDTHRKRREGHGTVRQGKPHLGNNR